MRWVYPLVLSASLLVAAGEARAAAQDRNVADTSTQPIIDVGNKTVELLIERFRPAFPSSDVDLLSKDKIRVVALADFNAFADYKKRQILIPAQFVSELLAQTQATLILLRNPGLKRQYAEWLVYLGKRSTEIRRRALSGETPVDDVTITPFWTFARLPVPERFSKEDAGLQETMMTESLALVVAHELGHLVLRHRSYAEISAAAAQQQEYAADAFAAKLVEGSGMSVMPGLTTFIFRFAVNEGLEKGIAPSAGTYPPAECRLYRLGNPAIEELVKSPDRQADFERSGLSSVSEFRQTMKALEPRCAP